MNVLKVFTLVIIFIGSFFAATQELPPQFEFIPLLSVILLALPSYVGLIQQTKIWNGIIILAVLSLFAFGIENIAIMTGMPYGEFYYFNQLGFKIGEVPWTVAFAWTPLLLGSAGFSMFMLKRLNALTFFTFVLLTTLLMVMTDLVLDPGAVSLRYWEWRNPGIYYGVPVINYFGWIVSSVIGSTILYVLTQKLAVIRQEKSLLLSWQYSLVFWTGIVLWKQLWIAFILGIIFLIFMYQQQLKPRKS